jgi:hypothetical protein
MEIIMAESKSSEDREQKIVGLASLPKPWATAVQLVGTFGLAVFLVLYYVLVMRPEDNMRYESLRTSVESLVRIVEKNHTLVTEDLEQKLQSIYIDAVSVDLAEIIMREREHSPTEEKLADLFKKALIAKTSLFHRLSRRDGRSVSELLSNKIQNFEIANMLASQVMDRWGNEDRKKIVADIRNTLDRNLSFIATAK